MELTDFDTLTFDCYGTLIDWESGIFAGLKPLIERARVPLSRDQSNARLQVAFDAIFTAEGIGSYKPSPRNFEYMLEKLGERGIKKAKILHTAESLFHDHKPASEFGLASCWIYRRYSQPGFGATMNPGWQPNVAFRFNSMADFAKAHQEATAKR
ncbi:hypothetical protein C7410_101476 [Paraburkholderia silvatlantica]|uniref:Haloacid dehalogenase n=1 Tax=Paraburkholderia silvatlantica TaxID=321895 RepID=A0A2V4UB72_9BURK|nr:hypothetical protein [Paraburkholderia silvatlantica]PYE28144.1 hypothetical protein C7410_101476 [Paraburkholderia silvatlantica]